ncbi:hypothetical protein OsI_12817 [Oryza sativa Indica Group]|uniref:Uncharacterized protein n=1 Tax=Oryza sativa subsp. indica TaxID=39946 RepID=A2XK51_ORYSI|nr:hypothetical protein OsI_12817 [Oryza sativa Indica Group]
MAAATFIDCHACYCLWPIGEVLIAAIPVSSSVKKAAYEEAGAGAVVVAAVSPASLDVAAAALLRSLTRFLALTRLSERESERTSAGVIQGPREVVPVLHHQLLHPGDLTRVEQDCRNAQAYHAYHARAAASVRVAVHDALFVRDLAAIPEDRWAHDGDYFERPLDDARGGGGVLFRVLARSAVAGGRVKGPKGILVSRGAKNGGNGVNWRLWQKKVLHISQKFLNKTND